MHAVPTTNNGVVNPGLFQSHDGTDSCANKATCPAPEITQMVKDGVEGTPKGDGLKQCIGETNSTDVSKYYKAARLYNSVSHPHTPFFDGLANNF